MRCSGNIPKQFGNHIIFDSTSKRSIDRRRISNTTTNTSAATKQNHSQVYFFTIVIPFRDCLVHFTFGFIYFLVYTHLFTHYLLSSVLFCAAFVFVDFETIHHSHLHRLQFTTFQQTIEMHSMHARSLEVKNNGHAQRKRMNGHREIQNSIDSPKEFRNNLIASYRTINWMVSFKVK